MEKIRAAIVGWGNLGRGAEVALARNSDFTLTGIFSRRDIGHPLGHRMEELPAWQDQTDVLLLCGGSATDLPRQAPELAAHFNVVDSFDTHAMIPEHYAAVDAAARAAGKVAVISTGWDPGLFSLARVLAESVLPSGAEHTFWGRGVSQGHSDALRRVPGVADARQYTNPSEEALQRVRAGENPVLSTRQRHTRECFVVLAPGADPELVRETIVTMPHYFADYDTSVTFVSAGELQRDHAELPHGGFVVRSGETSPGRRHLVEFSVRLDSNPEFTASILVAYARAAHRLARRGERGAFTPLDIPIGLLSARSPETLRSACL